MALFYVRNISHENGDAYARDAGRLSYVMTLQNSDSTSDPWGSHLLKNPRQRGPREEVLTLSCLPTHIVTCYRPVTTFFRSLSNTIVLDVFIAVVVIAIIVKHCGRWATLSNICQSLTPYTSPLPSGVQVRGQDV